MKDIIKYAYHITVDNIKEYEDYSVFQWNQKNYYFIKVKRAKEEMEILERISKEIEHKKIPIMPWIQNVQGSFLTLVKDQHYILLETTNPKKEYSILDMIQRQKMLITNQYSKELDRTNWPKLWSEKVDYLEYQVHELGKKYPLILKTFSYFDALAETAIQYARRAEKNFDKSHAQITLEHKRIFYPNYSENYDNPLTFIFDLEVRDIAEYIKNMARIEKKYALIDLKTYLDTSTRDLYSLSMLYARLLYPSYYFDAHDIFINQQQSEEKMMKIIDKMEEYEIFLKESWLLIRNYAPIEPIDWIIKKEL